MPSGFQNEAGVVQQEAGFGYLGSQFYVSNLDGLTAKASGTQANATLCSHMVNRVTTVANIADAVQLPPARAGHEVCLINTGANAMQVFSYNGTSDTINGVAGSTGLSQQASSAVFYVCPKDGVWIANGIGNGYTAQYATYSSQTIAANTNNSQTLATPITAMQALVNSVPSTNSSVKLPAAGAGGMEITIMNNGTSTLAVYTTGTDTINGSASQTQGTGIVTIYFTFNSGSWFTK
jgi:hypothetical protein